MADNNEHVDSEIDDQADDTAVDVSEEQDVEVLRQKVQELNSKNGQLFSRAKKAEGFVKDNDGKWVKPLPKPATPAPATPAPVQPEAGTITPLDAVAIAKADVHEDDIQEVIDYAKFKKVSVADALKSDYVKSTLDRKTEERRTAQATATGPKRPGSAAKTGEGLLEKARSTGELPESQADLDSLVAARFPKRD
jgi:hypothetical protein